MASLTVTNYSDEMTTLVTNKKFLNSSVTAGKAKIASFSLLMVRRQLLLVV